MEVLAKTTTSTCWLAKLDDRGYTQDGCGRVATPRQHRTWKNGWNRENRYDGNSVFSVTSDEQKILECAKMWISRTVPFDVNMDDINALFHVLAIQFSDLLLRWWSIDYIGDNSTIQRARLARWCDSYRMVVFFRWLKDRRLSCHDSGNR